eukprot:scaffold55073_cov67-Phaeocystis_antarctica.AAC.5
MEGRGLLPSQRPRRSPLPPMGPGPDIGFAFCARSSDSLAPKSGAACGLTRLHSLAWRYAVEQTDRRASNVDTGL